MKYEAIFFDRDGTLTYPNPDKVKWLNDIMKTWSGIDYEMNYDKMLVLFEKASEGKKPSYKDINDEKEFFRKYYYYMLIGEGVKDDLEKRANLLFDELWCNNDRLLYPEVIEVLEYFKSRQYKMGVISDTSPSLEFTLQQLGIAKYFTSFTASSIVGAGKPSPIIFNAALKAQEVSAEESIFIDDYKPEADGAREQGFTSFWLDRSGENSGEWILKDLKGIVRFAEQKQINI